MGSRVREWRRQGWKEDGSRQNVWEVCTWDSENESGELLKSGREAGRRNPGFIQQWTRMISVTNVQQGLDG